MDQDCKNEKNIYIFSCDFHHKTMKCMKNVTRLENYRTENTVPIRSWQELKVQDFYEHLRNHKIC